MVAQIAIHNVSFFLQSFGCRVDVSSCLHPVTNLTLPSDSVQISVAGQPESCVHLPAVLPEGSMDLSQAQASLKEPGPMREGQADVGLTSGGVVTPGPGVMTLSPQLVTQGDLSLEVMTPRVNASGGECLNESVIGLSMSLPGSSEQLDTGWYEF